MNDVQSDPFILFMTTRVYPNIVFSSRVVDVRKLIVRIILF